MVPFYTNLAYPSQFGESYFYDTDFDVEYKWISQLIYHRRLTHVFVNILNWIDIYTHVFEYIAGGKL